MRIIRRLSKLFTVIYLIFLSLNIIGCSSTSEPKVVVEDNNPQFTIKELEGDPDYQDWIDIEKNTSPFKKDLDWGIETLQYLSKIDKKWNAVYDKRINDLIQKFQWFKTQKNFGKDQENWDGIENQINIVKKPLKQKIIGTALLKKAPPLEVKFDALQEIAEKAGFQEKRSYPTTIIYPNINWKGISLIDGKKYLNGESFAFVIDSQQNIYVVKIPLGKEQDIKKLNIGNEVTEAAQLLNNVTSILTLLPEWVEPSLKLIFGKQGDIVIQKLKNIAPLNEEELMIDTKYFYDTKINFIYFNTKFIVDDKEIFVSFDINHASLSISSTEVTELMDKWEKLTSN